MAKTVDITDKLNFDDNPKIVIAGEELEVNADAEAVIQLIGIFQNSRSDMQSLGAALNLIFSEEDLKKIYTIKKNGKKLNARSLMTIMEEALQLVTGETEPGEQ